MIDGYDDMIDMIDMIHMIHMDIEWSPSLPCSLAWTFGIDD